MNMKQFDEDKKAQNDRIEGVWKLRERMGN